MIIVVVTTWLRPEAIVYLAVNLSIYTLAQITLQEIFLSVLSFIRKELTQESSKAGDEHRSIAANAMASERETKIDVIHASWWPH